MTIARLDIIDPTDTTVDWWSSAPGLKSITSIDFKPGLNVLFAPNGFGKSTILEVLGNLTHCRQGGLPAFTNQSLSLFGRGRGKGVRLVSDGALCFYADPSTRPGLIGGMAGFDDDFHADGIISAMAHVSSGEWCTWTINRVAGLAFETKTFEDRTRVGLEKLRQASTYTTWQATQEKVDLGPSTRTILLDEFDRSLDIPMAAHTWAILAKATARMHQLIIAAHSPMVLKLADAGLCNLIDLCPGYSAACRESLRYFDHDLNTPPGVFPQPFTWKPRPKLATPRARK